MSENLALLGAYSDAMFAGDQQAVFDFWSPDFVSHVTERVNPDAVGSDIEVMMDSGVRTGADMMRALALGARSCIIGRSYVYGLGAGGQAGVARAIEILKNELDITMALCGVSKVSEVDRSVLADTETQRRP